MSSKLGMFILYAPACVMGFASFFMYPDGGTRFMLLKSAVTIHFFKRVLESQVYLFYVMSLTVWGCEYTPCLLNSGTSDKECSDPGGCEGIFDENDPKLDWDENIRLWFWAILSL
ncbi:hypothetical protein KY290_007301 [Solanum tuberosum]|uniref:Sugar transporter n=1 Tax=Solanum tuberosum TaxID=4113 RepID=A0ABQ7W7A9_SOLTU|nr:hypothetical protein KY289_007624 [Solanum tuberosum]KAH0775890.1 hypothetical protein KY290_007301 [Solanum tuberosum]